MQAATLQTRAILQGVSRSFSLSIRLLPGALREPVGLAYLLARTSDTVADTSSVDVGIRLSLLECLQQAIHLPADAQPLHVALRDFAQHVCDAHEQALLLHSQEYLKALEELPHGDQIIIREVMAAITEGQRWDLLTLDATDHGVMTRAEVERYTWQVAGSVGEFWTRMCERHLQHWHSATLTDLMQWGTRYGQGLQRLNILRDAHRDLQVGRCYFPAEELQTLGLDGQMLCAAVRHGDRNTLLRMAPLLDDWLRSTHTLLQDGLRYSLALKGWRLRLASALPCLIGIRTLGLLRQAGPQALLGHLKLPRREVRQLLWRLVLSGVSDRQLQDSWDQAVHAPSGSPL